MLATAETLVGRLCDLLFWIAGLAVAAMMLHITADIFGKNLFRAPIHGTLEITTYYYMPLVALAPLAVVQRNHEHIFVELFSQKFSPRLNAGLDAFMSFLTVIFFGLIAWFSFEEALSKTLKGDYVYVVFFDLQTWPTRWMVPLVSGVVVLVASLQVVIGLGRAFGSDTHTFTSD